LFAIVGMALGVFAILFLGTTPNLVARIGGAALRDQAQLNRKDCDTGS
jgi:hypothetical protein